MISKLLRLAVIVPLFLLTACEEAPQPVQQPTAQAPAPSQQPSPAPVQPAAPKAPERSGAWPFLSADEAPADLAANLTARNFMLIFDGSGSMSESECAGASRKIDIAKKAVAAWSKSVPADANLGLYAFHSRGIATLPLSAENRDGFIQSVMNIRAGGKTPLTRAMLNSFEALTSQGRRQLGYGEYTIVVVTDGIANNANHLKQAVDKILAQTPITIYSIGFCIGSQHSLNQPGRTLYKSADNPEQLVQGLQEVLAESEIFDEQAFSE
jgi:Ca-activated chloride channel family protein